MRLRPRERRLALIAAVLIGCWTLVTWVVEPLWHRVRDQRLQIETQTERLEAVSRLLAKTPSIERSYEEVAAYLKTDSGEQVQGILLNELEGLSRQTRTHLNLTPRPVRQDDRVTRIELELDVEGSQQELLAFLDALLGMPKLIAINRVRISSVPAKADVVRANLLIQELTLRRPRGEGP